MKVEDESFDVVQGVEPITDDTVRMIGRSLGPIQSMVLRIGEVDVHAGAGIINKTSKCLWTRDGRRITLNVSHGAFAGGISNGPDPTKP